MSVLYLPIDEIHTKLRDKEITVSDLVNESLKRIKEVEGKLNCFITLDEEGALQRAKGLDEQGEVSRHPLFGIPMAIKDNLSTKGLKTTCASRHLDNYIPVFDATVVEKLQEAQAVMMGKLNMDEFAMGSSNETSAYEPVRNPWNTDHVPGGSSGGSAAAVAAGEIVYALGSDTGGSIRQPAAFCGVVGLKPTYGLISRYGLIAFASSLDQVGPITRTVADAAHVLQVIAGHDERDSTSAKGELPDYVAALNGEVKGMKIAVPKEFMDEGIHPEVREKVLNALKVLESLGAAWEEVSLPHVEYGAAAYYVIASSEASSNLARFDGVRYGVRAETDNLLEMYSRTRSEGFGAEVKRRIILGTYFLSSGQYEAYFKKAQQVRTLIKQDFEKVLADYDVIIGPTAPNTAWKIGEEQEPLTVYKGDSLTCPVNLAGLPAISVPCGFDSKGLPVGLQIIGPAFQETRILQVAHALEQQTEHHKARPKL